MPDREASRNPFPLRNPHVHACEGYMRANTAVTRGRRKVRFAAVACCGSHRETTYERSPNSKDSPRILFQRGSEKDHEVLQGLSLIFGPDAHRRQLIHPVAAQLLARKCVAHSSRGKTSGPHNSPGAPNGAKEGSIYILQVPQ